MKLYLTVARTLRLFLIAVAVLSPAALADVAVIVHPSNTNEISTSEIKRIYLGQLKVFPDGSRVTAIDQQEGSLIREMFGSAILKKNKQQLKSYWAQLMFTGQGTPPKVENNDQDVKTAVAGDPSAIGYIDAGNLDSSVKVIHRF